MSGDDPDDLVFPEQVLHFLHHAVARAFDFPDPSAIDRAHVEYSTAQLDRRDPRQSLTDSELPGEVRPIFRRRLTPDDFGEHAG
jgi:hypothetical protein